MRKKIFTFLLALAASVGMSWATDPVVISTNTGQPSYTQGDITITCSRPGTDSDGFYLEYEASNTATITNSGSSTISQIELEIGWFPQNRTYVRANGAESTSSDQYSITFTNVNSNNVTLTITNEKIQIRRVTITLADEGGSEPAGPIPCTAADRGKVLCTDGSIYATVSEATAASKTAAAVIAYVDTENGKALALALANESGTMDWETAKTTAAAHTPAVSGGTWTLASKVDWDHMINAAGGYNALRDCFSGVGGTNIQQGQYWTSTEYDSGMPIVLNFGTNDGGYFVGGNEDPFSVRACLAFDIPAAVNIAANVDPEHAGVYYATFYDSAKKYALPNDGTEAYAAEVSGDALLLHKIAEGNDVLPENTAVIFKATSSTITLTESDADAVTITATNNLHGVNAATSVDDIPEAGNTIYVLSGEDGVVGFYRYAGSTLGAHKAYIALDAEGAAKAPRRLVFHTDEEQGIEDVQNAVQSTKLIENGQVFIIRNGVRYNMAGQIVK